MEILNLVEDSSKSEFYYTRKYSKKDGGFSFCMGWKYNFRAFGWKG